MSDDLAREPHSIPFKFRAIAAAIHAIFAIPMGLSVAFYLWMLFVGGSEMSSQTNQILTIVFYFVFASLPMMAVWPIIIWATWSATKAIHPFVNLTGRDVLNYSLSNLISTLSLTILLAIMSGFLYKVPYFHEVSLGMLNFVASAFVANSIIASMFALRGARYQSLFIHPFLRAQ